MGIHESYLITVMDIHAWCFYQACRHPWFTLRKPMDAQTREEKGRDNPQIFMKIKIERMKMKRMG
jgi:hypothetical protein